MNELSTQSDVPFLTAKALGGEIDERDFREQSHLNYRGARKYSQALARALPETSLQKLVERHPALRTTFHDEGGAPVQRIHSVQEIRLTCVDARLWSDDQLGQIVRLTSRQALDLTDSVFRATLFSRAEDDHVLLLMAHEIAVAPGSIMVVLPSDHVIEPASAFRAVLARAAGLSRRHRRLFTLGAVPTRPETGYGYIAPGDALPDDGQAHEVARFVEKPDRATAEQYIAEGCLWNTGIFVWPAALLLDEIRRRLLEQLTAPVRWVACVEALRDLGARSFVEAGPGSVLTGLLRRIDRELEGRAVGEPEQVEEVSAR